MRNETVRRRLDQLEEKMKYRIAERERSQRPAKDFLNLWCYEIRGNAEARKVLNRICTRIGAMFDDDGYLPGDENLDLSMRLQGVTESDARALRHATGLDLNREDTIALATFNASAP